MDILDANKLLLFIAFVMPGFISLKAYQLLFHIDSKDSNKLIVDAIAYSSINYAILLGPIYIVENNQIRQSHPTLYVLFYIIVLLIAPIVWVVILKNIRTVNFFLKYLPHPINKPWDFIFAQRKPYWVIVTLKDGQKIGGRYDSESFSSSSPSDPQLYLEENWVLSVEGGFERPRLDTAGILILSSEIVAVEFFKFESEKNNVREETESTVSGGVSAGKKRVSTCFDAIAYIKREWSARWQSTRNG